MGLISTIQDIITKQLYLGSGAHVIPRGIAVPLDPFAKGAIRFGRKLDFLLPILVPENRYTLEEDAIYQMDRIELNRDPDWIDSGGYVFISGLELHEVEDVVDTTVILTTKLLADHLAGQPVHHYSNPVVVEGAYSAGHDIINIDTKYFIVRGDIIAISSSKGLTLSFKEYTVQDFFLVSTVAGINQYQITLDRGIHRDLADEEVIQIRAYLAYKSMIMPLPIQNGSIKRIYGPYLIDWASVTFVSQLPLTDVQTLYKYNAAHIQVGPPEIIDKNTLILNAPIKADQFLFWDKVNGGINYDATTEELIIKLNHEGKWWLKHSCVPNIKVPFTYASGYFVTTDKSVLSNNEYFRISDGEDAKLFEYKVDGTYVPTPSAPADGQITVTAIPTVNNQWFFLDDGFGKQQYFEYIVNPGTFTPTPGYAAIDVSAAVFPTDVAVASVEIINGLSDLGISASRVGPSIVLVNDRISMSGNVPIQLDPVLLGLGWTSVGMVNGTDGIVTIDVSLTTTSEEVALLTSLAINRSELKVRADNPGMFNSFKVFSTLKGTAGNIPITKNISAVGFLVSGMSGGTGGFKWHFEVVSDQNATMRLRLFPNTWLPDVTLVAGVSQAVAVDVLPTDEDIERIDILALGVDPTKEIRMKDWNTSSVRIDAIAHEYVAHIYGDYNAASTGLWIKPILPSIKDGEMILDLNGMLDAGLLRL